MTHTIDSVLRERERERGATKVGHELIRDSSNLSIAINRRCVTQRASREGMEERLVIREISVRQKRRKLSGVN